MMASSHSVGLKVARQARPFVTSSAIASDPAAAVPRTCGNCGRTEGSVMSRAGSLMCSTGQSYLLWPPAHPTGKSWRYSALLENNEEIGEVYLAEGESNGRHDDHVINMITSFTNEATIGPTAAPMMMPTAISATLPRMMKALKSLSMGV